MSTSKSTEPDTWTARLCRSLRNLVPAWPQSEQALISWPSLQHEPMMTDDDCRFHGHMLYFRGLLDDIQDACIDSGVVVGALPTEAHRFSESWYANWPADVAGGLLAEWRAESAA